MAKVNLVDKKVQMQLADIVRFQLVSHCYINNITITELELDCLTELGIAGDMDLIDFCEKMAEKRLQKKIKIWSKNPTKETVGKASPQTIRNAIIKAEKEKFIKKEGRGRKKISLNPELKIQTSGNIILNYKIFHVEI